MEQFDPGLVEIRGYYQAGFFRSLKELSFSNRLLDSLDRTGIQYIGDLISSSEEEIIRIPNLGEKSIKELNEFMNINNLNFSTKLPFWRISFKWGRDIEGSRLLNIPEKSRESEYYKCFRTTSLAYFEERAVYDKKPLKTSFFRTFSEIDDERLSLIMSYRYGVNNPIISYKKVAEMLEITQSRVACIEGEALAKIRDRNTWPLTLEMRLKNLFSKVDKIILDELEHMDSWFSGFSHNLKGLEKLIFGFARINNMTVHSENKRRVLVLSTSSETPTYICKSFSNERVESLFKSDGISKDESSIRTKELEIFLNNRKETNLQY